MNYWHCAAEQVLAGSRAAGAACVSNTRPRYVGWSKLTVAVSRSPAILTTTAFVIGIVMCIKSIVIDIMELICTHMIDIHHHIHFHPSSSLLRYIESSLFYRIVRSDLGPREQCRVCQHVSAPSNAAGIVAHIVYTNEL